MQMRTNLVVVAMMGLAIPGVGMAGGKLKDKLNALGDKIKEAQDPMSAQYKKDRIELDAAIEALKTAPPPTTADDFQALHTLYSDWGSNCTVLYDGDESQACYERAAAAWGPAFLAAIEQRIGAGDGLSAHWGVREYADAIMSFRWGETKPPWPIDQATRASALRTKDADALFERYGRYAKSHAWGCVPSAKPLPKAGDAPVEVNYHVKRDATFYVRCFLPSTVETYIQGKEISDFGARGEITEYPSLEPFSYGFKINYNDHLKNDWVDFEIETDRNSPKADFGTAKAHFFVYWIVGYEDVWDDYNNSWIRQPIGENYTETVSVTFTP